MSHGVSGLKFGQLRNAVLLIDAALENFTKPIPFSDERAPWVATGAGFSMAFWSLTKVSQVDYARYRRGLLVRKFWKLSPHTVEKFLPFEKLGDTSVVEMRDLIFMLRSMEYRVPGTFAVDAYRPLKISTGSFIY